MSSDCQSCSHFANISNVKEGQFNPSDNTDINNDHVSVEELDCDITVDEVKKTIRSLSRYKACDYEKNVADFFIDACDFISPLLCSMFNNMFTNCVYPTSWSKGVKVPIYKKGDKSDPANYRGITLVNVTAKVFSLILRNRINKWCESNSVFYDGQFGFRDSHSTDDAVFLLHAIIQKVLDKKSKLWCVFVDYQRAFDSVNRDALWIKLVKSGISCMMTNMIKLNYNDVQSCVRLLSSSGIDYLMSQ